MTEESYTKVQVGALKSFYGILRQLIEVEALQERVYRRPVIGMDNLMDQAVADFELDSHHSYPLLESRLRNAITNARLVGLGQHPHIRKAAELLGLDEKMEAA